MRLVVTGVGGQVARALVERGPAHGVHVATVGRPSLDLSRPETVDQALVPHEADVVVNAAAFTAVDRAESEALSAFTVNEGGAGAVAAACSAIGVPLIHLSTDYVFDGLAKDPYREDDAVAPKSAYGRSKAAGERAVLEACGDSVVLRLAWIYSPFGANFARTMLRLAMDRDVVRVVDDQYGAPTSALDIGDGVIAVAKRLVADRAADLRGVFHMTSQGSATWAQFAAAIFAESERLGGSSARVEPIATSDFPTPAVRPANSRLDCSKLRAVYGLSLPHWRGSVDKVVARLLAER